MLLFVPLLLWAVVLTLELIYSWAFSFRDANDRPLAFREVILWVRIVEHALLVAVLIISFVEKHYYLTAVVGIAGWGAPRAVVRRAYWAEVRRRAEFQARVNKMERSTALDIARGMLDEEIKEGCVAF